MRAYHSSRRIYVSATYVLLGMSTLAPCFRCWGDCDLIFCDPGDDPNGCDWFQSQFVFDPPAGQYSSPQRVRITFNDLSAIIHYTLDGREPSDADPILAIGDTIQIEAPVTITAKACSTLLGGVIARARYDFAVGAVTINPSSGEFAGALQVLLSSSTPGATLSYAFGMALGACSPEIVWIDAPGLFCGQQNRLAVFPDCINWQPYVGPVTITSNTILLARAEKPPYLSSYAAAKYQLVRLPRPEFHPVKGPISNDTLVAITSPVAEATIRYTLDGSDPTAQSPIYHEPLVLNGNSRLRARAFKEGYAESFTRYTFYRALPSRLINPVSSELPRAKLVGVTSADRPLWITHAGDGTMRLFVVEESGNIRVVGQQQPFLDTHLRSVPQDCPIEQLTPSPLPALPLISAAFPPDYDSKAYFYVSYHAEGGAVSVARYYALTNSDVADAASAQFVTNVPPTLCNNGGQLVFARDGTLYVNAGGPIANAALPELSHDLNLLSGKMIPILNENGLPLPEPVMQTVWPFEEHFSATNCSIRGGVFPNGSYERMNGLYIFGDESGRLRALKQERTNWNDHLLLEPKISVPLFWGEFWVIRREAPQFRVTAFGEDESGRVYVAHYGTRVQLYDNWTGEVFPEEIIGGAVYRIDDLEAFSVRSSLDASKRLKLEWQSAPGCSYQLQISTNLIAWTDFLDPQTGTGDVLSVNDLPVESSNLFFRVAESESLR